MRKSLRFSAVLVTAFLFSLTTIAQTVIVSGNVKHATTNEGVSSVSVSSKDGSEGTYTDQNGDFKIILKKLPAVLVFTHVSFTTQELNVTDAASTISISLAPRSELGQEVVISATRTPVRILESPVSIERVSAANIRNSPASNYYDIITNLKGVDVIAS